MHHGALVLHCLVLLAAAAACQRDEERPHPRARLSSQVPVETLPSRPAPALLFAQSQMVRSSGGMELQPARLNIAYPNGGAWELEVITDDTSNVFHAARFWRGGILTAAGSRARLRHWHKRDGRWRAVTLWERSWGDKFDRFRDLEIADVDADGEEEIVLATHDRGVVAVGNETMLGWSFLELNETADTFVHEVETGDVDGDGIREIYATPSARNPATSVSQGGTVMSFAWNGKLYEPTVVASWSDTHAKEILVSDVSGDGRDELFIVKEAAVRQHEDETELLEPVEILRARLTKKGWKLNSIAHIPDTRARFLVPGDVDGDGQTELVLAAMTSGVWLLDRDDGHAWAKTLLHDGSGGFEHAATVADMDADGQLEIYTASDTDRLIRRFRWTLEGFAAETVLQTDPGTITWSLLAAPL